MSFEKPRSIIHIRIRTRKTSHSDINDKSTYKSPSNTSNSQYSRQQVSKQRYASPSLWSDKNCLTIDHHRNIEKKKTKSVLIFTKMKYYS